MLATDLSKGFDEFLFGIPLIALLVFGFFRLDETFTKKTKRKERGEPVSRPDPGMYPRQHPQSLDPRRSSPMSDPDGRPWKPRVPKGN